MTAGDHTGELAYLSATEARQLFLARKLSPVELMEAVLARTESVEPVINAFTERLFDHALEKASEAERRFFGKGGLEPRPLEGIPVAAKEKHAMAGHELTEGSRPNVGAIATENAPVIDRVLGAGGIIHARTTTPEYSIAYFTHSDLWGITRNPWNTDFTPGGSSGGAAASLAAGTTVLATASDIGGSIRVPAAFTGTVGFKAPYGRIPGAAPLCLDHYRGDGPLARTVDDCITFTNVLAGPDPRDHASLRPKQVLPNDYAPVSDGIRIALCLRLGGYSLHPEVEANTRAVAEALADAGAHVSEIELPWRTEDIARAATAHFAGILGALVSERVHAAPESMNAYTVAYAKHVDSVLQQTSYLDGLRIESRLQRQLAEAMEPYDALICPTTAIPGLPAGDDLDAGVVVDGVDYGGVDEVIMTTPFNINNRCPVLNVPSGRSSWGVPTGVQIVGRTYDDPTVFRVGKAVEHLRPWSHADCFKPQRSREP